MSRALLVSVRFHDGRYHGRPEWPPSPARLFQALLAGAARGGTLSPQERAALAWLETLAPPIIAAPATRVGRGFKNYVPNNDLDAVGRDPRRVAEIRAPKLIRPRLFDAETPLLYAWAFGEGEEHAKTILAMTERLYQLGRGVDMAWACGEIIEAEQIDARLRAHRCVIHLPSRGGEGQPLSCPQRGSLQSLERRFVETRKRLAAPKSGRQQLFSQASKPRFAAVIYGSLPQRILFELRKVLAEAPAELDSFASWPLARAVRLVENLRDRAADKLATAMPQHQSIIDRVFIGRDATAADKDTRLRIIPLPSIGSPHVARAIRRVLVEVPPNCPLAAEDVAWAFSALTVSEKIDQSTGEVLEETKLVLAKDEGMLRHYGIAADEPCRMWRTVTPAALPEAAGRRRIDPATLHQQLAAAQRDAAVLLKEAKPSRERQAEESRAAAAAAQALRHAGIAVRPQAIRVQREPFEGRNARAEAFAPGTRFAKERLWHVEITFDKPRNGPLVIGDGRYLGLGIMAPVREAHRDIVVFPVPVQANIARRDGAAFVHAARRALMALSRDVEGNANRLFSGHEPNGGPASSGRHEHVFLAVDDSDGDGRIDRFIVAAPWAGDRTVRPDRNLRQTFEAVVSRLETVRAGRLGIIALDAPISLADHDPLVGPARVWESRTPYHATRHAGRNKDARIALARDVATECRRRHLPEPEVEILEYTAVSDGGGLRARARLRFATAIAGPLLIGRDSHRGGGLFGVGKE